MIKLTFLSPKSFLF